MSSPPAPIFSPPAAPSAFDFGSLDFTPGGAGSSRHQQHLQLPPLPPCPPPPPPPPAPPKDFAYLFYDPPPPPPPPAPPKELACTPPYTPHPHPGGAFLFGTQESVPGTTPEPVPEGCGLPYEKLPPTPDSPGSGDCTVMTLPRITGPLYVDVPAGLLTPEASPGKRGPCLWPLALDKAWPGLDLLPDPEDAALLEDTASVEELLDALLVEAGAWGGVSPGLLPLPAAASPPAPPGPGGLSPAERHLLDDLASYETAFEAGASSRPRDGAGELHQLHGRPSDTFHPGEGLGAPPPPPHPPSHGTGPFLGPADCPPSQETRPAWEE